MKKIILLLMTTMMITGCASSVVNNQMVWYRCWDTDSGRAFVTKTRVKAIGYIRAQIPECDQNELTVVDLFDKPDWKSMTGK